LIQKQRSESYIDWGGPLSFSDQRCSGINRYPKIDHSLANCTSQYPAYAHCHRVELITRTNDSMKFQKIEELNCDLPRSLDAGSNAGGQIFTIDDGFRATLSPILGLEMLGNAQRESNDHIAVAAM
jgi:hypothetical protein